MADNSPARPGTRLLLAAIARREAALELAGDDDFAGPAIERYLAGLRAALNDHAGTTQYSDPRVGYEWCGAFVYYCCRQAGFAVAPKPVPSYRFTLAAVPAWHHWAVQEGFFFPADATDPQLGDIAIYNGVYDGLALDHLGVVVAVLADGVLSAEGNTRNRSGLFHRPRAAIAGFVRLPENQP